MAADLSKFTHMPIETLAYHYTHGPPRHVEPRDNVIVWLVVAYDEIAQPGQPTREVSFSVPLTHPRNKAFYDDMVGWSRICDRLFIYDYAVNFTHPLIPHPNLRTIGANMKLYAQHNVKSFRREAHSRKSATELAELRTWLLAKLAWDPTLDTQALIDEFCQGYYGAAGGHVIDYINTMHDAVESTGDWLTSGAGPSSAFLSYETVAAGWRHLQSAAEAVADNSELSQRVRVAQLPVRYVVLLRWDEFRTAAQRSDVKWTGPELFDEAFDQFFDQACAAGVGYFDQLATSAKMRERLTHRRSKK